MDPGRIPRRRRLLRAQRVPHHLADPRGVRPVRSHRLREVLPRPCAAPPPAAGAAAGRRRGGCGLLLPRCRGPGAGRHDRVDLLRQQLVVHPQRLVVLRVHRTTTAPQAPVVAGSRGAVLPGMAGHHLPDRATGRPARRAHHGTRARRALHRVDDHAVGAERVPRVRRSEPRLLRHRLARHGAPHRSRPGDSVAARPPQGRADARREVADHRYRYRGAARRRVVLRLRRGVHDVALPERRLPRPRGRGRRAHRHGHPPRLTARRMARHPALAVHRPALVRALPVALAHLHGHPPAAGRAARRHPPARAAPRPDVRHRGAELPVRRDADPPRRDRPLGQGVARIDRSGPRPTHPPRRSSARLGDGGHPARRHRPRLGPRAVSGGGPRARRRQRPRHRRRRTDRGQPRRRGPESRSEPRPPSPAAAAPRLRPRRTPTAT